MIRRVAAKQDDESGWDGDFRQLHSRLFWTGSPVFTWYLHSHFEWLKLSYSSIQDSP